MANVIKTVLTYQLDGSNRDFNIPFEYLARKFVVVTLIGVDRKVLTINTDYRFATRTTISLTKAWGPADGYTTIELRRVTSTTDRLVDFTDGSILRAYDLNVAQIQTMHVAEEARDLTADTIGVNNDGHLDARGRRIVNLANAVDDRDAVPLGQLKVMNQNSWQARNEALQFRNEAETFRNQAEGFKNESGTNAANTKQWRDETNGFRNEAEQFKNTAGQYATSAGNSATAAHQSEVNAGNSATASADSAASSKQQADRAKQEADKLGNWNALAGTVDSVQGDSVFWKGGGYWVGGPVYQLQTNHAFRFRMGLWEEGDFLKSDFAMDRPDGIGFIEYAADKTGQHRHQIRLNQLTIAGGVLESDADDRIAHAFADQYNTKAPFFQQIHVQSTSSYHPIIKQRTYQSGRWAGCWSIGTLLTSTSPSFHVHMKDEGAGDKLWTFNTNGDFRVPGEIWADGGRVVVRNGSFDPEGRVWGNVYDTGYLDDWVRRHFIGDVYLGPQSWQQQTGGYQDIIAPAGHVQTGTTASNGAVAGIFVRPVWLGFHNGTRRIIASQ
ncbi:tail fiber protein [Escherichia phage N30]|uniref:Tail fiber protein n=1 Tax=Escherichia phage N30 TaxID=2340719 RepID=A0A386K861_9CAUD|nr:tail fiber protein [Escherichia phage N30]AYD80163.1 tail fiber protein [Escherichia phage N30]